MRPFGVGVVDFPLGPAFEDLFDGHPTFRPGQRRAEAEVQALPEAEVAAAITNLCAQRRLVGRKLGLISTNKSTLGARSVARLQLVKTGSFAHPRTLDVWALRALA